MKKKLGIALAALVILILLIALVLPLVFDANNYRDLIESRAEKALGRDVRLGEMRLSLFPTLAIAVTDVGIGALPEEGGGDLLTAGSLRVGARLGPLLGGRLEVTSLALEDPSMVLARDSGGEWNIERLLVDDADGSAGESGELSIDRLVLSDATLTYRDATAEPPLEVILSDLDVQLDDVSGLGAGRFELATSFASVPETRLNVVGRVGLAGAERDSPFEFHADIEARRMTGELLSRLATGGGVRLGGLVGEAPFDATMRLDMTPDATTLTDVLIDGADIDLRRDAAGRLNLSLPEADGETEGSLFIVRGLRLEGLRLRWLDTPRGRPPIDVTLTDLDAQLFGWPREAPTDFRVSAKTSSGGSLEVGGRAGPGTGDALDLAMDLEAKDLPGSLVAALATAGGVSLDGVVGERPIDIATRLEITGDEVTLPRFELGGAELDLRRDRDGRWNFRLPEDGDPADSSTVAIRGVVLDDLRLHLRDATVGERPLDAVLDDLRLELDQLPSSGPAAFRLTARVTGDGGPGSLDLNGRAGPSTGGPDLPLQLSARIDDLPLATVQPMLDVLAGDGEDVGRANLELTVGGSFPSQLETAGTARVTGARVASGEPGLERLIPLDLEARFDASVSEGGEDFDFRTLDVDLEGSTLSLRGTVEQEGEARRWNMSLAPTRLPADRLRALLALFTEDTGLSFSSDQPIEIEARIQGTTASGHASPARGGGRPRG